MLIAINSSDFRTHIDDANIGDNYYCPLCRQLLIQKKGQKRIHHFAHYNPRGKGEYSKCTDRWNYDKTEWHMEWQNRFPKECIEYVVSDGHKKHFADVLINQTVIEFQHSSISYEAFIERNDFYSRCGYKVIWVFDISDAWNDKKIEDYAHGGYKWLNPKKVFRQMDIKEEKATVFFQFDYDDSENEYVLEKVTANYNYFKTFYTDIDNSLSIKEFVDAVINDNINIHKKKYIPPKEELRIEGGKTVYELCDSSYSGIIVKNLSDDSIRVIDIFNGSPQKINYNVVGYYAKKQQYNDYYDINRTRKYAVWHANKPIWQLLKVFYYDK